MSIDNLHVEDKIEKIEVYFKEHFSLESVFVPQDYSTNDYKNHHIYINGKDSLIIGEGIRTFGEITLNNVLIEINKYFKKHGFMTQPYSEQTKTILDKQFLFLERSGGD